MKLDNLVLYSLFIFAIILNFFSISTAQEMGDYWLQLTQSQRVNYLVGYVQGADPATDLAQQYKGTVYESLLYSSQKLRKAITERVTELYQNRNNRMIDWKSMLLLACSELEGESRDIVEKRLMMFRELFMQQFGPNYTIAGDYWLSLPQTCRYMYLKGLIEGIRTNIIFAEQQNSDMKAFYESLVNVGSEIDKISDIVTDLYSNPSNKIIDYRFLFPIAYMKFIKMGNPEIEKHLKQLRKTERSRRITK